jgi:hypothetical protein
MTRPTDVLTLHAQRQRNAPENVTFKGAGVERARIKGVGLKMVLIVVLKISSWSSGAQSGVAHNPHG